MSLLEKRIINDSHRKAEQELDRKFNEFRVFLDSCYNPLYGFAHLDQVNEHLNKIKNLVKPSFIENRQTEALDKFYRKVMNLPD